MSNPNLRIESKKSTEILDSWLRNEINKHLKYFPYFNALLAVSNLFLIQTKKIKQLLSLVNPEMT